MAPAWADDRGEEATWMQKVPQNVLDRAPGEIGWAVVLFDQAPDETRLDQMRSTFSTVHSWHIIPAVGVVGDRDALIELAQSDDVVRLDAAYGDFLLRDSTPQVGAPTVWDTLGFTGDGVTVAVLDTGIDENHPDLAGKVAKKVSFETYWAFIGGTEETPGELLPDAFGHGTHVAGTVAGTGSITGPFFPDDRYIGVAPGADLVSVQISNTGGIGVAGGAFSTWAALDSIQWVTDNAQDLGIRIATNSWGLDMPFYGYDFCLDAPVSQAILASIAAEPGLIWVFAAGNEAQPERIRAPACLPEVITVGAVDHNDEIAGFSSRGPTRGDAHPKPDVVAPGVSIVAAQTLNPSVYHAFNILDFVSTSGVRDPVQQPFYTSSSGTSMAAPHVAGVVALMVEAAPCITMTDALTVLQDSAIDLGDPGFNMDYGYGLVAAPAAVQAAQAVCQGN
jgi:serine protease AprX